MSDRRCGRLITFAFVLVAGAGLAGCQTDSAATATPTTAAPAQVATAAPAAPARPMTREQASTDCWMKYEKGEGRGMSLDQRLSLVEKCTAEKMKAAAR
jgi:hypothetical protein